jgi:hypothetical protein
MVRVCWLRDSQPGSCNVAGWTYVGCGPRYRQRPGPDGRKLSELEQPGEQAEMPLGAAVVLCDAG